MLKMSDREYQELQKDMMHTKCIASKDHPVRKDNLVHRSDMTYHEK